MRASPLPYRGVAKVPRATYRLQFNGRFRLADGLALVPYLQELGISHVYASPLFQARPQSPHGYDVCDFGRLNAELGTEADFEKLVAALHERGMGLVLDIVPNHMGIWSPENHWWWDVLTHGPESEFADYFDIDWLAADPQLRGKVLAPVLVDSYEQVLARREIRLVEHSGDFVLRHLDCLLPLTPHSLPEPLAQTEDRKRDSEAIAGVLQGLNENQYALHELICQQYYLPAWWREADTRANYRRFFNVATLAGLRTEEEKVFNDSHALIGTWLKKGWIEGLRVDHPDGLRDPTQYLDRLRRLAPEAWIVVEKILEPEETISDSWPVAGTTGYDFLNTVNGLFVAPEGERQLTAFYADFTREPVACNELVPETKRRVLSRSFAAEVSTLCELLVRVASRHKCFIDFTREDLSEAILEFAACLPVYRTYVRPEDGAPDQAGTAWIERAEEAARGRRPDLEPNLFVFLRELLLLRLRGRSESEFVARFQQLSGPAMAKGVEDKVFYRYNRLVSLNEVGAEPGGFGVSVSQFHEFCRHHQAQWPEAMLATSTHDTKRSEDVRARINLLSEIPENWCQAVCHWHAINGRHSRPGLPDRNTEYLFYQTLVGAWPLSLERALAYMEKATCEAGKHTFWEQRNAIYEGALREFIFSALANEQFIADLNRFLVPLIPAGYVNSLAQTLLKLTAPGVTDIYEGCELWDLSLVDPDNRRPVDFELRRRLMEEMTMLSAEEVWQRRDTGLPKLWLIKHALALRARRPGLFSASSQYEPLSVHGEQAAHAVAFIRAGNALTVVPRLVLKLNNDWANTRIELPHGNWRNELTAEDVPGGQVSLATLLRKFPVALLTRKECAI